MPTNLALRRVTEIRPQKNQIGQGVEEPDNFGAHSLHSGTEHVAAGWRSPAKAMKGAD
jgi:hypothetical protein